MVSEPSRSVHGRGLVHGTVTGPPQQPIHKAPSLMNISFLKAFGSAQKKPMKDGQAPKRRGPKPDSKPAQTRRQELNRQAQRTHRERKEQYIRALETEVSRLREAYTADVASAHASLQQHGEALHGLREENAILKDILASHNINYEAELQRRKGERPPGSFAGSSTGSQSAGLQSSGAPPMFTTPPTTISSPGGSGGDHFELPPNNGPSYQHSGFQVSHGGEQPGHLDFSSKAANGPVLSEVPGIFEKDPQLGVDFVLTLEAPCRVHTEYLCRRSASVPDEDDMPFSGHALMASCPPPTHIHGTTEEHPYPHQTYDLPAANLATLLNLSRQLVTDGQITPIMALQSLKNHELYPSLTREDVKAVMDTLLAKIRCYGFGAVVEDFELMDCLSSVLGTKIESGFSRSADDMMYS
ncbi:hypothetical protein DTO282F9_8833 [Paecilomyces variotii]|nr:hypothetical protein DTO282F9_8833 [Paecilomyces variotii]